MILPDGDSPDADAAGAARAFLTGLLDELRPAEQQRVETLVRGLVAVEALIGALRDVAGAEAAAHRAACEAERARLAGELGRALYGWQLAGGVVALSVPHLSPLTADGNGTTSPASEPVRAVSAPVAGAETAQERPAPVEPAHDGAPADAALARRDVPDAATPAAVATEPDGREDLATPEQLAELVRMMGRAQTQAAPQPASAGFDAETSVRWLGVILDRVTLPEPDRPLAGPAVDGAVEQLVRDTEHLDDEWGPLPADYQRLLISLFACYGRFVQDAMPEDDPARRRLAGIFPRLTSFSRYYQPGRVNGLALDHRPQHGTWLDDARLWLARLKELAGYDEPTSSGAAKKARAATVTIDQVLREEGFAGTRPQARVRELLVERGIIPRTKSGVDARKREEIRSLLHDLHLRVCSDECKRLRTALLEAGGEPIAVEDQFCDICEGSNNRRAALAMVACLRAQGLSRLLVVGGGDDARADLENTLAPWEIEVRVVDGTKSPSQKAADNDMNWAQVMVVWGGTQLPHKVSDRYRKPPARLRTANPNRRGVEALCRAVIERICPT